jgi:hypothetical protein
MPPPDRRYDWRDDYDEQPRRSGTSPGLILALVLGGLLLLVVGCGAVFLFRYWATAIPPANATAPVVVQADPAKGAKGITRVYTRQEFRDLVMGKVQDEVIAAVGKPDETSEDGDVVRWTYGGRVRDPGPGQPAATPVVVFREGKAAEVQY